MCGIVFHVVYCKCQTGSRECEETRTGGQVDSQTMRQTEKYGRMETQSDEKGDRKMDTGTDGRTADHSSPKQPLDWSLSPLRVTGGTVCRTCALTLRLCFPAVAAAAEQFPVCLCGDLTSDGRSQLPPHGGGLLLWFCACGGVAQHMTQIIRLVDIEGRRRRS